MITKLSIQTAMIDLHPFLICDILHTSVSVTSNISNSIKLLSSDGKIIGHKSKYNNRD